MSQAIGIMDRRVNGLGVTESQVQLQGRNQISVALPGVTNQQQALAIIGKTAQLEFYVDADTRVAGPAASQADVLKSATGLIPAADMQKLQAYVKDPTTAQPDPNYSLIQAPPGIYLGNKIDRVVPLSAQAGDDRRRHLKRAPGIPEHQQRAERAHQTSPAPAARCSRRSPSGLPSRERSSRRTSPSPSCWTT